METHPETVKSEIFTGILQWLLLFLGYSWKSNVGSISTIAYGWDSQNGALHINCGSVALVTAVFRLSWRDASLWRDANLVPPWHTMWDFAVELSVCINTWNGAEGVQSGPKPTWLPATWANWWIAFFLLLLLSKALAHIDLDNAPPSLEEWSSGDVEQGKGCSIMEWTLFQRLDGHLS